MALMRYVMRVRTVSVIVIVLSVVCCSQIILAQKTDDLLVTTNVIGKFPYGIVNRDIWASLRNDENKVEQWQFRYEPLFSPDVDEKNQLIIEKNQLITGYQVKFKIFLDNSTATNLAYQSVLDANPAYKDRIKKQNVTAIRLSSLSLDIPLLKTQIPAAKIDADEINSSFTTNEFVVKIYTPDDETANLVIKLFRSNVTIPIKYRVTFAARTAKVNSYSLKMTELKKSNLFAKLNGKDTTETFVHRDDMRKLMDGSSTLISITGVFEEPDKVDSSLFDSILSIFNEKVTASAATFDAKKWDSTYNGDDLKPDVITKALNKIAIWDEGTQKYKIDVSGDTGGSFDLLGIFKADGHLKGGYSKDEMQSFLKKHDIETSFEGNKIVPKSIELRRVNMAVFNDESKALSTTSYVSEANAPLLGHVDLNVSGSPSQLDFGGRLAELEANQLPVGAVIPFFLSSTEIKLLAPNWLPADGSVVSDAISALNGKKLPNLLDRTILGADKAKDILAENQYTVGGTQDIGLTATVPSIKMNGAQKINQSGFSGSPGTSEGNFVTDTPFNESAANHIHTVDAFVFSVSGSMPFQPFRRLVYMVKVR